jgi:hypothetical protein
MLTLVALRCVSYWWGVSVCWIWGMEARSSDICCEEWSVTTFGSCVDTPTCCWYGYLWCNHWLESLLAGYILLNVWVNSTVCADVNGVMCMMAYAISCLYPECVCCSKVAASDGLGCEWTTGYSLSGCGGRYSICDDVHDPVNVSHFGLRLTEYRKWYEIG